MSLGDSSVEEARVISDGQFSVVTSCVTVLGVPLAHKQRSESSCVTDISQKGKFHTALSL